MRKGGEVSARKFLAPQYLGKVPPLNMESGAFLGINNKVGTIETAIAKWYIKSPVPDVSNQEAPKPYMHFNVNASGEGHWYR